MDAAAAPSSVNSRAILKGVGPSKGSNVCSPPPLWIGMFCPGSASHHYDITQDPSRRLSKAQRRRYRIHQWKIFICRCLPTPQSTSPPNLPQPPEKEQPTHWQHMKSYKTSNKAQGKSKIKNTKKPKKKTHTSAEGGGEDGGRSGNTLKQ